ncbi:MAG: TonB-dependent receptor [Marinilabiliales bacterium]|nr:TonB-dependent receptor [Marinilabiliales bacterium]
MDALHERISIWNYALYGNIHYMLMNDADAQLSIHAGLRFDENEIFGSKLNPRAGMTYVSDDFRAKLLYSSAFRARMAAITAIRYIRHGSQQTVDGPVRPEVTQIVEVELGYRISRKSLYYNQSVLSRPFRTSSSTGWFSMAPFSMVTKSITPKSRGTPFPTTEGKSGRMASRRSSDTILGFIKGHTQLFLVQTGVLSPSQPASYAANPWGTTRISALTWMRRGTTLTESLSGYRMSRSIPAIPSAVITIGVAI